MTSPGRRVVLVSGAPGSGKTTLAVPLAAELGFALLSKDRIKETLHDALGAPVSDLAWSSRLGAAAMELLGPWPPTPRPWCSRRTSGRATPTGGAGYPRSRRGWSR